MKHLLLGLSIVFGAWALSPTPEAQAWSRGWNAPRQGPRQHVRRGGNKHAVRRGQQGSRAGHRGSRAGVPELDPSAAGSAIVLLLGGVAYIASRRREEYLA